MSYLDAANLANDLDFRKKVIVAIVTASTNIIGETPSDNPQKDSARKALGIQVINNPNAFVDRFALAVVANPAISEISSDSDIQFTVNSIWDDVAGV